MARARRLFFESSSRSIFLFEHDLFGKPRQTFPDHPLGARRRLDPKVHKSRSKAHEAKAGLQGSFGPAQVANIFDKTCDIISEYQRQAFLGMRAFLNHTGLLAASAVAFSFPNT